MNEEINGDYLTCYNHPERRTLIHCAECGKAICLECAVSTDEGYLCVSCLNKRRSGYRGDSPKGRVVIGVIAGGISLLGALLQDHFAFLNSITAIALGVVLGTLIMLVTRAIVKNRWTDSLNHLVLLSAAVGGALPRFYDALRVLKSLFCGQIGALFQYSVRNGNGILYVAVLCAMIWVNQKGFTVKR